MAQLVKRLTLDLGSGHDLTFRGFEPRVGLWADSTELAWESLSHSLSLPLPCVLSLSLKRNKLKKKERGGLEGTDVGDAVPETPWPHQSFPLFLILFP